MIFNLGEFEYDNLTNQLNPAPDFSRARAIVKGFDQKDYPIVDFESRVEKRLPIKHLRLQVGLNCNYKCSFCIQKEKNYSTKSPSDQQIEDTIKLVDRITSNKPHIELWGGEPLVYWKAVKKIIIGLKEVRPDCHISMISNGTLINKQIIDFLVANRVELLFSHDGPAYWLRGKDPLEDKGLKDLWLYTNEQYQKAGIGFALNVVISQYNCDLFELDKWFARHLPNVPYRFEGCVIAHAPNSIPFTQLNKEQKDKLVKSIYLAVLGPDNRVVTALSHWLRHILRFLAYQLDTRKISGKCDAIKPHVLSLDFNGNILSCHNTDQVVGTIKDIESEFTIASEFKSWQLREECKNCYCLLSCRGNCMRNSDELHKQGCEVQKTFHSALMDACFTLLYSN